MAASSPSLSIAQRLRCRPRQRDTLAGYRRQPMLTDIGAGITVGVVALPLALAFAIASGLRPEQGLATALVAGLLEVRLHDGAGVFLDRGQAHQAGGPFAQQAVAARGGLELQLLVVRELAFESLLAVVEGRHESPKFPETPTAEGCNPGQ